MNKVLSLAYFAGGSKFTVEPFNALNESRHHLKIVLTKSPKSLDKGKKKAKNFLLEKAKECNVFIKTIDDFKNLENLDFLKSLNLDFIVVFSFGMILPKKLLEIPKYGCINIHASLLPKWRGASPVQHVLLNNEKETGYTFIMMNEGLDEGNIVYKEMIDIDITDNYSTLLDKIIKRASKILIKKIEGLADDTIKLTLQNHNEASYCYKIKKEDTYLKFDTSAQEVFGKIRAFCPSPGAKCYLEGELIKVLEAKVEGNNKFNKKIGCVVDDNLLVSCKIGFIRFLRIQRAGRKAMLSKDFLNGCKVQIGSIINE